MWSKIKKYTVLLFLIFSISQGFACGDCWFSKLEVILETSGSSTFKNFIRNDADGFAKFENLYKAVGSNRIDDLLDPDVLRLFDRIDGNLKNSLSRQLNNTELLKFSQDVARVSDPVNFISTITKNPRLVDSWRFVSDLPPSKIWVRQNIDVLVLFNKLSVNEQNRLKTIYRNLNLPRGSPSSPPFTMSKTIDGNRYTITYNEYGFPEFYKLATRITGANGRNLMRSYPNSWNPGNAAKDLRDATKWAMENFPPDRVRRTIRPNGSRSDSKIDILDDNGNWITQTWHHHENGRDLFPVPSKVHNSGEGGFRHSGGDVVTNGNPSLKGLFNYRPIFN